MATLTVDPNAHPDSVTSGIQETIDGLPAEGGVVHVPAGTYTLRRSIVPRAGTILQGEGAGTVLTRPAPIVSPLAESTKPNDADLALEDATGLKVGDQLWVCHFRQGGWHSRYVLARGFEGARVKGELLFGDPERTYLVEEKAWAGNFFPAVWIPRADGVTIRSLTIDGGERDYDPDRVADFVCAAIHTRNSNDLRVADVNIRRWPSDGIGVQGGGAIVTGCIVEDCLGNGLHPGTSIGRSVWTNNISRRNRHGLLFCQRCRNTVVAHNLLLNNRENGIWGLGEPDCDNVVMGNVCAENGWYGIEAYKGLGNAIVGNVCRENSQASPGAYSGILLQQHRDNVVVGNVCRDDREKPTQVRGIDAVDPKGRNRLAANHAPRGSAYWKTWQELEEKVAEHEERKKTEG